MGQTRQDDTRTELSRPGEPGVTTRMVEKDIQQQQPEMLKVREHSMLLSAQNFTRCMEPVNVCHSIPTRATPKRQMKDTLYTRHRNTVEPMMVKKGWESYNPSTSN